MELISVLNISMVQSLLLFNGTPSSESVMDWNCTDSTDAANASIDCEPPPQLTQYAIVKGSILSALAVASILANSYTLLSIALGKKSSSSLMYTLLFQLVITDLLVSIWCLSGEAVWTFVVEWKAGDTFCRIFKFFQVFSLYLSTYLIVLIGFDRLNAISHPMRRASATKRSFQKLIIIVWIMSAILASPQLVVFRVVQGPFKEPFFQCVTHGFYTEDWQPKLYAIYSIATMFVLPLSVLIGCYARIFRTIAKNENLFKPDRQNESFFKRKSILRRAKMRSLRISIIIVTMFIIWWTPYWILYILSTFADLDQITEGMSEGIFFFGMSNSLVNPIVYGAFHLWTPKRRLPGSFNHSRNESDNWRRGSSKRSALLKVTHGKELHEITILNAKPVDSNDEMQVDQSQRKWRPTDPSNKT